MVGTASLVDSELQDSASMMKRPRSSMVTEICLKEHKDLYLHATSLNSFFNGIADGKVPPKTLMFWLNQHRLHARIGFIKLLGHTLARVTTMDERNFPHEHESFDLIAEAVGTIHQMVDFLGHILLELEDENEVGIDDICFTESGKRDEGTNVFTPANWHSIDFLLASASDATLPECLVIIWSLAQLYHDGWATVKEKMIVNGSYPSDESSESASPVEHDRNGNPGSLDRQMIQGLWGSNLTPTQKLVAHWTSAKFAHFVARMSANVQGYVDINALDVKVASKLFQRTLVLESAVWPQV